ncbi:MAG TPA: hypothetical protein VNT60_09875 [Deinococcales bacterium]|nr:hypothetical protein [Deinococcales bacterium]
MKRCTLEDLRPLVWEGRYTVKSHATRHAIAEGFTERDIVATLEQGRELAVYPEDGRMLVLGYLTISPQLRIPLHVVVDYSPYKWLDVVTAFIPDDPYRVMSRERVAILVRHGRHEPREHTVRPNAPRKTRPRVARAWRGA